MTPRQQRFIEEYLVDGNGTAAAVRAGFAARGAHVTACRLLRNPKVAEAISEGQAETRRTLKIDRMRVIVDLQRAYDLARTLGQPAAMVAAARELGRLIGAYGPVHHLISVAPGVSTAYERMQHMTDEQLLAIMNTPEGSRA